MCVTQFAIYVSEIFYGQNNSKKHKWKFTNVACHIMGTIII